MNDTMRKSGTELHEASGHAQAAERRVLPGAIRYAGRQRLRTTLLELVATLQTVTSSEEEVVLAAAQLINTGRVVLCGNFAGHRVVVV